MPTLRELIEAQLSSRRAPASAAELAHVLDEDPHSVHVTLSRMCNAQQVRRARVDGRIVWTLAQTNHASLEELLARPSAPDKPPVRAIGSVTRFVVQVAGEAAVEAIAEHIRLSHAPPLPEGWAELNVVDRDS
jgi:hypothetical protein